MRTIRYLPLLLAIVWSGATVGAQTEPLPANQLTAIDEYVHKRDRSFRTRVVETVDLPTHETVVIDMTSQRWLNKSVVDRPLWQHRLLVTIPKQLHDTDIAFLYISGGSNTGTPKRQSSDIVTQIALATNTVVAELRQVPNQPLVFHDDGQGRYEDDLIAYSWKQYLRTQNPLWLPRNAMVKSAVRAMDALSRLMQRHRNGQHKVSRFVVSGASKRGWTTWLTGAMDNRVVAIVPIVIDVLNVDVSMRHHFDAYGFWAPSIGDYVNHSITHRMGSEELRELHRLVDPLSYINRVTMPKFVVNAAGDQFFLPDSSQFYWNQTPDPKWIRYVPNTDHGLGNSDAAESVAAFHYAVTRNLKLPQLSWQYGSNSEIHVNFTDVPSSVSLWSATNEHTRDFRMQTFGPGYQSTPIDIRTLQPGTTSKFSIEPPEKGWTAWFVEMIYDIGFVRPFKVSTEVRVAPDRLPFKDKAIDKPTSLTLVISNPASADGLFDSVATMLAETQLGKDLAIVSQHNYLYVNFTPIGDSGSALMALARFLGEQLAVNTNQMSIQLESGKGPTIQPY